MRAVDDLTLVQRLAAEQIVRARLVALGFPAGASVAVSEAAGRNRGLRVDTTAGVSFFVKQGAGRRRARAVAHEAATYAFLHARARGRRLGRYLPRFEAPGGYDGVILVEMLPGAESLAEHHERRARFAVRLAARLGDALGALHQLTRGICAPNEELAGARRGAPGVLSIHRPTPEVYRGTSGANIELIRLVQRAPELCRALDALRAAWRVDALIHGDVKAANVVVARPAGPRGTVALALIDWETAQPGDSAWDVGSMFAEYLGVWALSVDRASGVRAEERLTSARLPLARVRQAARAAWRAYARRLCLAPPEARQRLLRAVRYAGARLVQSAYEHAQTSARLPAEARALLQLGGNVSLRPLEATVHLLGIPLDPQPPRPRAARVGAPATS